MAILFALRNWGDLQPWKHIYRLSTTSLPSSRTWDQPNGDTHADESSHRKVKRIDTVEVNEWSSSTVDETALAIPKRQGSRRITIVKSQRKFIVDVQVDPYWPKWMTKRSKLAAMDFETSEYHQDTWNRYIMLGFVSAHIARDAISNLELRWSYKALRSDLVLPSTTTLSNICLREYALTVDAIEKQLPSWNKLSLALDGWTSTNKITISSVIAYYMIRTWALCEAQLPFDEVDCPSFSAFESKLWIRGQGPTHWTKTSHTFEGRACSFSLYRRPFAWNYNW